MVECTIGPWCLPPFLEMLRATGARRGEVLALRWCDIRDGAAFIDGCWIQASLHVLTGVFCAFLVFSNSRNTAADRRGHNAVTARPRFQTARRAGGWSAPSWRGSSRTGRGGCAGAARLDLGSLVVQDAPAARLKGWSRGWARALTPRCRPVSHPRSSNRTCPIKGKYMVGKPDPARRLEAFTS